MSGPGAAVGVRPERLGQRGRRAVLVGAVRFRPAQRRPCASAEAAVVPRARGRGADAARRPARRRRRVPRRRRRAERAVAAAAGRRRAARRPRPRRRTRSSTTSCGRAPRRRAPTPSAPPRRRALIQARQALTLAQTTLARVLGHRRRRTSRSNAATLCWTRAPGSDRAGAGRRRIRWRSRVRRPSTSRARRRTCWRRPTGRALYLQSSVFARGSGANPDGHARRRRRRPRPRPRELGRRRAGRVSRTCSTSRACARARPRRRASTRAETALLRRSAADDHEPAAGGGRAWSQAARAVAANTPVQLAAAQQSEAQARARYEAGLASIVEVADAQSLLAQAEVPGSARARRRVARAAGRRPSRRATSTPFIELARAPSGAP